MSSVVQIIKEKDAEIERLRKSLNRIQEVLKPADNAENVETVGRAREIALATLNDADFMSISALSPAEREGK